VQNQRENTVVFDFFDIRLAADAGSFVHNSDIKE